MLLKELKRKIDLYIAAGHEDDIVVIDLAEPSMGCKACSGVVSIHDGFDWDAHQIRIKASEEIVRRGNERDAIKPVLAKIEISPRGKEALMVWCPTCQTSLSKKSARYCSACGQRIDQDNPVIL